MRLKAPEFGAINAAAPTVVVPVMPMMPEPNWLLVIKVDPSPTVKAAKVALRSEPWASIVPVAKLGTTTALLIWPAPR